MTQGRKIQLFDNKRCSEPIELTVGQCLRSMPGRRMVYEGSFEGQCAVIKVFLSRLHGLRHFRRELRGLEYLKDRGISTAKVLKHGCNSDGHRVLVLKYIDNAKDIHSLLTDCPDGLASKKLISKMMHLLAEMHVAGVLQRDLHPGNFLWDGNTVYALDPAQMRFYSKSIHRRKCFQQLALLAAAFSSYRPDSRKELVEIYFQKRKWEMNDAAMGHIQRLCKTTRHRNIQRALKKTLRNCTHFVRQKSSRWTGVFDRHLFEGQDLPAFMAGLDDAIEAGNVIKRGGTCFVSGITLHGHDIVVKRYNHKGWWHSFRHTIKGSRAKKCWLFGHRLQWLGIPVAKPLAFIELRCNGLIRQSYILNEYIDGRDLSDYMRQPDLNEQDRQEVRQKTSALLKQIGDYQITHGDLKATNILIRAAEPVLIDLDSMKRHRCRWFLKLYQRKMENRIKEQNL